MRRRHRFGKLEWPPPLPLASPQLLLLQKWRQSLFHVAPDGKRTVRGMALGADKCPEGPGCAAACT